MKINDVVDMNNELYLVKQIDANMVTIQSLHTGEYKRTEKINVKNNTDINRLIKL